MQPGNDPNASGTLWIIAATVGSFLWSILVTVIGVIWGRAMLIGRHEAGAQATVQRLETCEAQIVAINRRMEMEIDQMSRNVGESFFAIRQKMNDMELWNRDNLVSKATFGMVVGDLRENWKRFEDKLDRRLDKIDDKLEDITPSK